MRLLACCLSLSLALSLASPVAAEVTLTREGTTVLVHRDGELFAAMQTDDRQAKPYLYPVMQPGWSQSEWTPGRYVTTYALQSLAPQGGVTIATAIPAGTVVTATGRKGDEVDVVGLGENLPRVPSRALVPVSGLAVREMSDTPLPYDRKNPAWYEHPHHRGIWIAIDEVAGTTFWNEDGDIDVVSTDLLVPAGSPAVLRINSRWFAETTPPDDLRGDAIGVQQSQVALRQSTLWAFREDGFISTRTTFRPPRDGSATFEDTKEGLLGVRMPSHRRENARGLIRNADGESTEEHVWGRESDWVDYIGPAIGDDRVATPEASLPGIALFAHPTNPRRSRYHVRGYGLFSINPFGPHAYSKGEQPADPLTLTGDESVTLRYGVWIHGDADRDAVARRYREYAESEAM